MSIKRDKDTSVFQARLFFTSIFLYIFIGKIVVSSNLQKCLIAET
jgi:hypothetical protein